MAPEQRRPMRTARTLYLAAALVLGQWASTFVGDRVEDLRGLGLGFRVEVLGAKMVVSRND